MSRTPGERSRDSSMTLLRDGYTFLPERIRRHHSDVFTMRLPGRQALCLHGPDAAARLFYQAPQLQRHRAVPGRLQKTLTAVGGVQGLDGIEHRSRNQLFMRLMTPQKTGELLELFESGWRDAVGRWELEERALFLDAAPLVLCRAVCAWAGVPLAQADVNRRPRDLAALVDVFGAVGLIRWRGAVGQTAVGGVDRGDRRRREGRSARTGRRHRLRDDRGPSTCGSARDGSSPGRGAVA